jgi:monomeric sarcosine oxidase
MPLTFDFVIIGSGVFGAWTAKHLRDSGARVALVDAYGPGNSRSSSGGESRIIRNGYGRDELYTRWAMRSFPLWQALFERTGRSLFHRTGVLWLGDQADPHIRGMAELLKSMQANCEELDTMEIRRRYPQLVFDFDDVSLGVLEPESGVLMARQAVHSLVKLLADEGVDCRTAAVLPPSGAGRLKEVKTSDGSSLSAGTFIFACGSWLPKLFPELLRGRIFPTRQEVFFLGSPAGSDDFRQPKMPAWLHHTHPDRPYAVPDLEHRGFKIAWDRHGPGFDPDGDMRVVPATAIDHLRAYLQQHIPAMKDAPVIETRVCHYENTWNGDFLIDHHPSFDNVWLAGGGSGHGFKHGPAVGEYLSARLLRDAPAEPRFSLASKQARQERAVY